MKSGLSRLLLKIADSRIEPITEKILQGTDSELVYSKSCGDSFQIGYGYDGYRSGFGFTACENFSLYNVGPKKEPKERTDSPFDRSGSILRTERRI